MLSNLLDILGKNTRNGIPTLKNDENSKAFITCAKLSSKKNMPTNMFPQTVYYHFA